jgi:hypothetical protein|tara:strand:- start:13357 stop:13530 length:174 start_codon:yes stop_codon:yes gene_type:complete
MTVTFYISEHQQQIKLDFVELVEKQNAEAKKNKKEPKSYSSILVDYMDYYVKKHKAK